MAGLAGGLAGQELDKLANCPPTCNNQHFSYWWGPTCINLQLIRHSPANTCRTYPTKQCNHQQTKTVSESHQNI